MYFAHKVVFGKHAPMSIANPMKVYQIDEWGKSSSPRFFFQSLYSAIVFLKQLQEKFPRHWFSIYSAEIIDPLVCPLLVLPDNKIDKHRQRFWKLYENNMFFGDLSPEEMANELNGQFSGTLVSPPKGVVVAHRWRLIRKYPDKLIEQINSFDTYKSIIYKMPKISTIEALLSFEMERT